SFRQFMNRMLGWEANADDGPTYSTLGIENADRQAEIEAQTADTQRLPQVKSEFLARENAAEDHVAHDGAVDEFADSPLDLDDVHGAPAFADEPVLDLDFEAAPRVDEDIFVKAPKKPVVESPADDSVTSARPASAEPQDPVVEIVSADVVERAAVAEEAAATMESHPSGSSPEAIDAIARRVVEHLSEKVVKEIAWEVVPELAELMKKWRLKGGGF